jgi:hypothetical protein
MIGRKRSTKEDLAERHAERQRKRRFKDKDELIDSHLESIPKDEDIRVYCAGTEKHPCCSAHDTAPDSHQGHLAVISRDRGKTFLMGGRGLDILCGETRVARSLKHTKHDQERRREIRRTFRFEQVLCRRYGIIGKTAGDHTVLYPVDAEIDHVADHVATMRKFPADRWRKRFRERLPLLWCKPTPGPIERSSAVVIGDAESGTQTPDISQNSPISL